MSQQQWRATITFAPAPAPITAEQADALMAALPGYGIAVHDAERIHLELTVGASTLRKATDEALRAAQAAYAAAFDAAGTPTGLRVLTAEDDERELARPGPLDLVGLAEITQLGGFRSRQAAHDATKKADFPAPVADLKMGKAWMRKSVEAFLQRWPRKPGWAGHKAAAAASK